MDGRIWTDRGTRVEDTPPWEDKGGGVFKIGDVSGAPEPTPMTLEFNGSAGEYFRIWVVNLCLTLVTFGIFSAWAKVRKKRYMFSHTTLAGTPFQYLAKPVPILKGRIIAALGFGIYYLCSRFITSMMPYVLAAGLVAAPWVLSRSAAFNARFTAFRNMTFDFDGRYVDALKTLYAWGILPLLAVGMILNFENHPRFIALSSLVFALHFPWWIRRLKKFTVEHTLFGDQRGEFSVTGGKFFKIYFISALIMLAASIPAGMIMVSLIKNIDVEAFAPYLAALPVYLAYVISFAYIKARSGNLTWDNIRIGPVSFKSSLRSRDLLMLYITNALAIIASAGMLIPWAVIRTYNYRVAHLQVVQTGTLYQFRGSSRKEMSAAGTETMDIFDMDLSL